MHTVWNDDDADDDGARDTGSEEGMMIADRCYKVAFVGKVNWEDWI